MITLAEIESRMRQIGLDAEGSERYLREIDIVPSVNAAVEWLVGVLTPMMGKDKFVEERLSDLHMTRVWQTNNLSRFNIEDEVGFAVWSITRVAVNPWVYMPPFVKTALPASYQMQITPYFGQSLQNRPLVRNHYRTGNQLKPYDSTFRPELDFVRSEHFAARIPTEQETGKNPFEPGYKHVSDFTTYGYRPLMDNTTYNPDGVSGGYVISVPQEIEVVPYGRGLIGMSFVRVPDTIPSTAGDSYEIAFPRSMMEVLSMKALNYISVKQGDATTIFNVSLQDVLQQLH